MEYLDCSSPGIHAGRWWQVLEALSNRCLDQIKRNARFQFGDPGTYSKSNAGRKFNSDVKSFLDKANLEQIVIMLDEIEYITHGLGGALGEHWNGDFVPFWQTIRAVHQETSGGLVFIVAGVNPACVERPNFDGASNPIFQLAIPQYLGPFGDEGVREMVRSIGRYSGLALEESVYSYLSRTFGGHPFLIRIACSEVWSSVDTADPQQRVPVSVRDFQRLESRIRLRLAQPVKDILLSLVWWYPEEYDLLQILASDDVDFVAEYVRENPESIVQPTRYGVLRLDHSGEFAISALKDFLLVYGDEYKKEISPFRNGDLPAELLPQIPDLEKLAMFFEQRCEIEIKLRKAIVTYLWVKFGGNSEKMAKAMMLGLNPSPSRPDATALFIGRPPEKAINELFTTELKDIISKHWDIFAPLFQSNKARFDMNMDTLNRARRLDAHTKPFDEDEARDFENSYGWLLNCLKDVPW